MNNMKTEQLMDYEKLIYSVIHNYKNYYDLEDLKQVGYIALLKACKNYSADKNTKFSTYAYLYIKGEVLKYVREDRAIKVNRDLIKLSSSINKAKEVLEQKLYREPTKTELSLFLDVDESLINEALRNQQPISSLDYVINDDEDKELSVYDVIPYTEIGFSEEILDLKEELEKLTDEEKTLINCRYFNDMTQTETSKVLGINQVKVSRTENKILQKLKGNLVA